MAILFADSLQQYGLDETAMLDGVWAELDAGALSFSLASTGRSGTYSLTRGTSTLLKIARRALGTSVGTVGMGFALYPSKLPNFNDQVCICDFRDAANTINLSLGLQSTGTLTIKRGNVETGTLLATSSSPCVKTRSYQHIEVKATMSATVGAVEVRVNGVTVISISSVNTAAGLSECSQIALLGGSNETNGATSLLNDPTFRYSDLVCWDTSGSYNNDFLGDHYVTALYPTGDTAQADWTPLSGTGYENIDDDGPDDDSTYIYVAAPGSPAESTSEFDITNLNSTNGTVAGIVVTTRARKDDAGNADLQNGVKSSGVETRGATHPINAVYTYHEDVIETDPNSGVAFTPTNINNLLLQLNRVT